MAGGKETPRQKMIGMMYLVLTALLALNVSKSILDAFVAIEENIQKANIVQVDRGDGFYNDVKSEMAAATGPDQALKRKKLEYVIKQMDAINKETESIITFIDKMKLEILNAAGENTTTFKEKDLLTLMWNKQEGVRPIRMNCAAVEGKDKYDEPMHVMGVADDIKRPTGNGAELWKRYNDFRSKIVELAGTYQMPGSPKKFDLKVNAINDFESNKDLLKKVTKMIESSNANLKEDKQPLIDLYMMLTKQEKNNVHDQSDVHWIGMTFDHAPLVAGIAALSSLEQDVLSARALAMANYKSKVSTGDFSFNTIMPLAYGPVVANNGEDVELKIMMAAFDSDNMPKVTVTDGATIDPANIEYKNGQGFVRFKAGASNMTLKGTVSIKDKNGVAKTGEWTHDLVVMKPQGTVSLPQMNMLYRGYDNIIEGVASGYDKTSLTGSNVALTKSGDKWIGKPGSGRTCTIAVKGTNTATGESASLGTFTFRVSNLPPPQVYLGTIETGRTVTRQDISAIRRLFTRYPASIPLDATFEVDWYEITVSGSNQRAEGDNGVLTDRAKSLLRQAQPGSTININVKYKGMGYKGNVASVIKVR